MKTNMKSNTINSSQHLDVILYYILEIHSSILMLEKHFHSSCILEIIC
jgi:hypothetical protein